MGRHDEWVGRTLLCILLFDHVFGGGGEDSQMEFVEAHESEGKAGARSGCDGNERRSIPCKDTACEDEDGTDGEFSPEFGRADWFFGCMRWAMG